MIQKERSSEEGLTSLNIKIDSRMMERAEN